MFTSSSRSTSVSTENSKPTFSVQSEIKLLINYKRLPRETQIRQLRVPNKSMRKLRISFKMKPVLLEIKLVTSFNKYKKSFHQLLISKVETYREIKNSVEVSSEARIKQESLKNKLVIRNNQLCQLQQIPLRMQLVKHCRKLRIFTWLVRSKFNQSQIQLQNKLSLMLRKLSSSSNQSYKALLIISLQIINNSSKINHWCKVPKIRFRMYMSVLMKL